MLHSKKLLSCLCASPARSPPKRLQPPPRPHPRRNSRSTASRRRTTSTTSTGSIPTGKTRFVLPRFPPRKACSAATARRSSPPSRAGSASRATCRSAAASTTSNSSSSSTCSASASTRARPRSGCGMPMANGASCWPGQTNSVFMDVDIFPNVIDYWGPTGMVFLRKPQFRWTPIATTQQLRRRDRGARATTSMPARMRELDPELGANLQNDEK